MSLAIWMESGGRRNVRAYRGIPWRVVEAQHVISTRKLVDSDDEQRLLEDLLEAQKPPIPRGEAFEGLHYLLFTSFRYPPLRHGSRFGSSLEPSLWYGSERVDTALAEVAYYRLVFLEGTEAKLEPLMVELSAFQAKVQSPQGVDLLGEAFESWREILRSKTSYAATQALGKAMREDGVEVFRYRSARDPKGGANVALFTPRAFAEKKPRQPKTWRCVASRARVEFSLKDYFRSEAFAFERQLFEVDGKLPAPAT